MAQCAVVEAPQAGEGLGAKYGTGRDRGDSHLPLMRLFPLIQRWLI